jgi:hypothetical protein
MLPLWSLSPRGGHRVGLEEVRFLVRRTDEELRTWASARINLNRDFIDSLRERMTDVTQRLDSLTDPDTGAMRRPHSLQQILLTLLYYLLHTPKNMAKLPQSQNHDRRVLAGRPGETSENCRTRSRPYATKTKGFTPSETTWSLCAGTWTNCVGKAETQNTV